MTCAVKTTAITLECKNYSYFKPKYKEATCGLEINFIHKARPLCVRKHFITQAGILF